MMKNGYIGEFEIVDDHGAGKVVVNLNGRVNKCGVLSPRFDMAAKDNEKWVTNLLPSRQFGHIVLTTPKALWITTKLSASRLAERFSDTSSRGAVLGLIWGCSNK